MTISLEVLARIRGTLTASPDAGTATVPINESAGGDLDDGTGANQANAIYQDAFSIGASSSTTLDLAGSLTDPLNQTKVFTAIKAILIEADSGNTNNIVVGNATNAFTGPFGAAAHTLAIPPGGAVLLFNPSAAGWAVSAGTADELKLANSGAGSAVTGRITIVGEA